MSLIYVSLHTSEPGDIGVLNPLGDQVLGELSYEGYERRRVAKIDNGWETIDGGPVSAIRFRQQVGGSGVYVRFFGVGRSPSGPGQLLFANDIHPTIHIANGVTVQIGLTDEFFDWLDRRYTNKKIADELTSAECLLRWRINRDAVERGLAPVYYLTPEQIECGKGMYIK